MLSSCAVVLGATTAFHIAIFLTFTVVVCCALNNDRAFLFDKDNSFYGVCRNVEEFFIVDRMSTRCPYSSCTVDHSQRGEKAWNPMKSRMPSRPCWMRHLDGWKRMTRNTFSILLHDENLTNKVYDGNDEDNNEGSSPDPCVCSDFGDLFRVALFCGKRVRLHCAFRVHALLVLSCTHPFVYLQLFFCVI